MKVTMLKLTNFIGQARKPGEVHDVDSQTAQRWISKGIAEAFHTLEGPAPDEVEEVAEAVLGERYQDMTAKELYQECLNRDIEVEAKKPKAYYIEFLSANDAATEAAEAAGTIEE